MHMKRLRHDLHYLTSAGLLVTVVVSALTGIVAHLCDLNDFWYHTYASYVMTVFALAHVCINWSRLVGYAKFRLGGKAATPARKARAAAQTRGQQPTAQQRDRAASAPVVAP